MHVVPSVSKQYNPREDDAERGISSGAILFGYVPKIGRQVLLYELKFLIVKRNTHSILVTSLLFDGSNFD